MKSSKKSSSNREHLRTIVERILVPHTEFELGRRRIRQLIRHRAAGATVPKGIAVLGESRTGKSRLLNAILSEWPPSTAEDGEIIPIVSARVPARPTIKGLAKRLLKQFGVPDWNKGDEQELTSRLEELFKGCGVLALALDEFHHFMDRRSERVQHEVADWLKNLLEETNVVLIVLGLPRLTAVIRQNEQLKGRFTAPIKMPRFDWFDDEQQEEWLGILETFSDELGVHFDILRLDSGDIGFRLWCATGGLVGYLTQLLTQATLDALDDNRRRISLADLAQARKLALFEEEANPPGLPSVLGPKPLICTDSLVATVRLIGVEEPPPPMRRRRSKKASEAGAGSTAAEVFG